MKKFLLGLILSLPMICPLFGQAQATNGFHRTAVALARAFQGVTAQVVPNAKVTVTSTATGLAATIYSDPALSSQITPAVVTADNSGNYGYYIPLGYCVTETISAPGQGSPQVITNICNNNSGAGTSFQTNSVNNLSQTNLNFTDTATVKFTNPSGGIENANVPSATNSALGAAQCDGLTTFCNSGIISTAGLASGLLMQVNPPAPGQQQLILYPTSSSGTGFAQNTVSCGGSSPGTSCSGSGALANGGSLAHPYCSSGCTSNPTITWTFTAPSYLPATGLTVYGGNVSYSYTTTAVGNMGVSVMTCGIGGSQTNVSVYNVGHAPPPLQTYTAALSGVTTPSQVSTVTCTASINETDPVQAGAYGNFPSVFLVINYTGTAPPPNTAITVIPPLNFNPGPNSLSLVVPFDVGIDTGSANAYAVSLPWVTQAPGTTVKFVPAHLSTSTTPTFNLNGIGAATIVGPQGGALQSGDLNTTATAIVVMDASGNWRLQDPQVSGSGGGTTTNALTANSSGGAAPGTTFNGSVARTFDYHSFGAAGISGTPTTGNCANWASASTLGDTGSPCGSGGGSSAFSAITGGTNTTAAMVVGSGASMSFTGTGSLSPQIVTINGTTCDVVWENSAGTVTDIDLYACSGITDYSNGATTGSLEWAINQLGTNGGAIHVHPGIYNTAGTILIDWDWITIEGTDLPYWSCCGTAWPTHATPGTPGGAQFVSSGGYATFTIGNTTANMHGDTRHKGIQIKKMYGYGAYIAGTSFIVDLTAAQHDDWMRVEDNTIQGMENCAITEQWDTHDIFHNTIQNNGGDGVCEAGGNYAIISQNIIYDNGGEAFTLSGGVNSIVSENRVGDVTAFGTFSGGTGVIQGNVSNNSTVTISGTGWLFANEDLNGTAFNLNSANTSATQMFLRNTTSGAHGYNIYTDGSSNNPGWGGVYDNTANSDAFAFEGGTSAAFNLHSKGVYGWTSSATRAFSAADTGLSRDAAGGIAVGNGTQGNVSGYIKATKGLVVPAGTAASGAAGVAVYGSDATNGYAEVNENNAGLSRVCTAANGVCGSSSGAWTNITGSVTASGCTVSSAACAVTGSAAGSITISAIPGTYNNLQIRFVGQTTNASSEDAYIQFNADTASHYDWAYLTLTTATTVGGGSTTGTTSIHFVFLGPSSQSRASAATVDINGYAGTTFYKNVRSSFISYGTGGTPYISPADEGGFWQSTAAITSFKIAPLTGNFPVGTTVEIYAQQ